MVILDQSLADTNLESATINAYETNVVSGTGPYSNPYDIYLPGHQTYLDIPYGEKTKPDISGIVKNIDLLKQGSDLQISSAQDSIREFKSNLLEDFILPNEYNGISVNLRFNGFNVITDENAFKNL